MEIAAIKIWIVFPFTQISRYLLVAKVMCKYTVSLIKFTCLLIGFAYHRQNRPDSDLDTEVFRQCQFAFFKFLTIITVPLLYNCKLLKFFISNSAYYNWNNSTSNKCVIIHNEFVITTTIQSDIEWYNIIV